MKRGKKARFRAFGNSMTPIIKSSQRVTVAPADPDRLEVGDIVIAEVGGTPCLHLIRAIDPENRRMEIAGNDGSINGWTSFDRVYAICTVVGGKPVPGASGKTRSS